MANSARVAIPRDGDGASTTAGVSTCSSASCVIAITFPHLFFRSAPPPGFRLHSVLLGSSPSSIRQKKARWLLVPRSPDMHLGGEPRPTRTRSPEGDDEGDFSPPPLPSSFPGHRRFAALTRSFAVRTSHVPDLIRHLCPRCERDQRCYATGPVPLPRRLNGQPTSPVSGRQPRAALQAARTDHSPARLGRHPLTKPVSLGPLSHVGLIGTFHNSTSFLALNRGLERPVRQGGPSRRLGQSPTS